MEIPEDKLQLRNKLLKITLYFIVSFLLALLVWIMIGRYYGTVITSISAYAIAPVKNLKLIEIKREKENIATIFITQRYQTKNIILLQNVNYSHFTFNVPLTIAIIVVFFPFIKKKRVYAEVAILIVSIHIIYVFLLEGYKLTEALLKSGYEKPNQTKFYLWLYSEGFFKSMVLRFEPFLIGAYLYFSRTRGLEVEEKEEED